MRILVLLLASACQGCRQVATRPCDDKTTDDVLGFGPPNFRRPLGTPENATEKIKRKRKATEKSREVKTSKTTTNSKVLQNGDSM